jgi:hypothetical protein
MFSRASFHERCPMRDEPEEDPNDPIDDEFDGAMMSAAELIAHVKRIGATELELPIIDESGVWILTLKKLGVRDDEISRI